MGRLHRLPTTSSHVALFELIKRLNAHVWHHQAPPSPPPAPNSVAAQPEVTQLGWLIVVGVWLLVFIAGAQSSHPSGISASVFKNSLTQSFILTTGFLVLSWRFGMRAVLAEYRTAYCLVWAACGHICCHRKEVNACPHCATPCGCAEEAHSQW